MRVAVVAEYYPRAHDPVLGIWAHRQALAAREAGAEVRVVVLHRPIPPRATAPRRMLAETRRLAAQPRHDHLDGLAIEYVPFVAPPRPQSYGTWGAWAAPTLAAALRGLRRRFPFDLVHAHNAVPAGDAVLHARIDVPLVVSVHGGDVFHTARRPRGGARAVRRALAGARLVLANSSGIERGCRELGAQRTRVVRLGTDMPAPSVPALAPPVLVTLAHLVARKRHADVVRAVATLRSRHPALRYLVIGDGPERGPLVALAAELGVGRHVELVGQLEHPQALARARRATLMVMPSVDEALGVAYLEAMAAGLPAIGCQGEPGPEEIARAGAGLVLVPPRDPDALAARIGALLADPRRLLALGRDARATIAAGFTWERCGRETLRAYEDALR